jgi:hypothetical protein
MKANLLLVLLVPALLFLTACTKNGNGYCNNGVLDFEGGETEIDCGGDCEACPPAGTFTATVDGYPYVSSSIYPGSSGGTTISFSGTGTAGTSVSFTFVGITTGTQLPITTAYISLPGSGNYEYELSDTGSVILSAIDTQRQIVSGTVSFSVTNGGDQITLSGGVFENVRY